MTGRGDTCACWIGCDGSPFRRTVGTISSSRHGSQRRVAFVVTLKAWCCVSSPNSAGGAATVDIFCMRFCPSEGGMVGETERRERPERRWWERQKKPGRLGTYADAQHIGYVALPEANDHALKRQPSHCADNRLRQWCARASVSGTSRPPRPKQPSSSITHQAQTPARHCRSTQTRDEQKIDLSPPHPAASRTTHHHNNERQSPAARDTCSPPNNGRDLPRRLCTPANAAHVAVSCRGVTSGGTAADPEARRSGALHGRLGLCARWGLCVTLGGHGVEEEASCVGGAGPYRSDGAIGRREDSSRSRVGSNFAIGRGGRSRDAMFGRRGEGIGCQSSGPDDRA